MDNMQRSWLRKIRVGQVKVKIVSEVIYSGKYVIEAAIRTKDNPYLHSLIVYTYPYFSFHKWTNCCRNRYKKQRCDY